MPIFLITLIATLLPSSFIDFTFDSEGQTVEITNVRSSGVIKKYDGKWKIAQIHWSVGVQGQVIEY